MYAANLIFTCDSCGHTTKVATYIDRFLMVKLTLSCKCAALDSGVYSCIVYNMRTLFYLWLHIKAQFVHAHDIIVVKQQD